MSLNLEEKKAVVAEVSDKVAQAQAIVLAEYRGLTVEDMTQLRVNARNGGVYLRVLKNTLARLAEPGRAENTEKTPWLRVSVVKIPGWHSRGRKSTIVYPN